MKLRLILSFVLLTSALSAYAQIYDAMVDLYQQHDRETYGQSAEEVQAKSFWEYQRFIRLNVNSKKNNPYFENDKGKPTIITRNQAIQAWKAASMNPVVSLYSYDKYDPRNQGIGFCFGRAMFLDLYLSINGLNRGSIKKAFVVGPMSDGGGGMWGWHVATIVQSKDERGREVWLAIDPILDDVLDVREWYREMLASSSDGKLRLYITQAGKFGVNATRYDMGHLNDPFYHNYFQDMMRWFERNDVSDELKLRRSYLPLAM